MKLDRNINADGTGKYALVKLRNVRCEAHHSKLRLLGYAGILDWGETGTESEFFVFRLKDKYAAAGLAAYAAEAEKDDPEYASEIREMMQRAGPNSPWCKKPD